MKKLVFLCSCFLMLSCQEAKTVVEAVKLSPTAEAIKQYKVTFEWQNGYESWSKVPTTDDYHMSAPLIGLEATGAAEIEEIIFGFVNENELKQELVDIVEMGSYVTCFLKLTTKTGEIIDGVEVFKLDKEGRVEKIWAL
ncbi:hypothetical protein OAR07_00390 [Flavobacteriaceae bacterium]|nr:hypothetical protein [Flavobacteriaceae bacterium]